MSNIIIVSSQIQCEEIWKKYFSSSSELIHNWEYNLLFHDLEDEFFFIYSEEKSFFLPCIKSNDILSLFPRYRYQHSIIGGEGLFGVDGFLKQNKYIFEDICYIKNEYTLSSFIEMMDSHFKINICSITNWMHYIEKFGSEKKGKIRNQMKKLQKEGYTASTKENITYLNILSEYNKNNFGESSDFNNNIFLKAYEDILYHFGSDTYFISIQKNSISVGVGMFLNYNGTLHFLNIGINKEIRDVGKFIFLEGMNLAIKLGCNEYDLGTGDCGWKTYWDTDIYPVYKIKSSII